MAIFTPRGLKIRIKVPYAFGLMARLHPKVTAFRILKTTEGIESLTATVTFIAVLICFAMRMEPIQTGIVIFTVHVISVLINVFGLFLIPGQAGLGTLHSYISGYGLLFIVIGVTGCLTAGWQGVFAYFTGRFAGWSVSLVVEHFETKRFFKLTGYPFTASERCFFNAYRLHADKHGFTTNIEISDEELEEGYWRESFDELATQWPDVVARFTGD